MAFTAQQVKELRDRTGAGMMDCKAALESSKGDLQGAIEYQQERNRFLQQQIVEMDKKIKEIEELEKVKANLLARMKVIEELQASRAAMVHFFDEVLNTLPEGVYIKALKQQGVNVTIDGVAESNNRVSAYMKNVEASRWFAERLAQVCKECGVVDLNWRVTQRPT